MKIIRFTETENNSESYGVLESDKIYPITNSPFMDKLTIDRDQVIPFDPKLLVVPCEPTKVVALAINYQGSTGQTASMSEPLVFIKTTNAVVECNQKIKLPFTSNVNIFLPNVVNCFS